MKVSVVASEKSRASQLNNVYINFYRINKVYQFKQKKNVFYPITLWIHTIPKRADLSKVKWCCYLFTWRRHRYCVINLSLVFISSTFQPEDNDAILPIMLHYGETHRENSTMRERGSTATRGNELTDIPNRKQYVFCLNNRKCQHFRSKMI